MGMRRSTRQELRKLRELVRHFLEDVNCCFCKEPMLDSTNCYNHGDGEGSPFDVGITIHHADGNHSNNAKRNRKIAHTRCHKAYHMAERHRARRLAKKGRVVTPGLRSANNLLNYLLG